MPRRFGHPDASAPDIDSYMAELGFSALKLDSLGDGSPDRLYGGRGFLLLVELKSGKGRLRASQTAWARSWRGPQPYTWWTRGDARATLLSLGLHV